MIQSNTVVLFKYVLWDLVGNVIYFPVWWYTRGLRKLGAFLVSFVAAMEMRLAVRIWVINLFRPMYAVTDIPGRFISFFMRLFMIIVRTFALAVIAAAALVLFMAYLAWPPFLALMILTQFGLAFVK